MSLDLPPLRAVIEAHGLWARKALGQNFILDQNLLRRIVGAAGPLVGANVFEVGPGPGGLTRAILDAGAARVIAVETDPRCHAALGSLVEAADGRLTLVEGDALAFDARTAFAEAPTHIIANLPYNIATPLLVGWLTADPWPPWWASLTLMFQKEVADRIVAAPDTEAYGRLAVLAQWRAQARIALTVPRQAFVPPPKVTSAVVHIRPAPPLGDIRVATLERLTEAAFGQRRKMLRSSLKRFAPDADALLDKAGIDGARRAETLSIAEFVDLARAAEAISA